MALAVMTSVFAVLYFQDRAETEKCEKWPYSLHSAVNVSW